MCEYTYDMILYIKLKSRICDRNWSTSDKFKHKLKLDRQFPLSRVSDYAKHQCRLNILLLILFYYYYFLWLSSVSGTRASYKAVTNRETYIKLALFTASHDRRENKREIKL